MTEAEKQPGSNDAYRVPVTAGQDRIFLVLISATSFLTFLILRLTSVETPIGVPRFEPAHRAIIEPRAYMPPVNIGRQCIFQIRACCETWESCPQQGLVEI